MKILLDKKPTLINFKGKKREIKFDSKVEQGLSMRRHMSEKLPSVSVDQNN